MTARGFPGRAPDIALRVPDRALLAAYGAALEAGWSPNTTRDVRAEHLAAIAADADGFLAGLDGTGRGTITTETGQIVPRLPGPMFWIVDAEGAFCGGINLRYQAGTLDLPPHVSGHVGYAIVPAQRGRGIATTALAMLRPIASRLGLPRVCITCYVENDASRRVIERNSGVFSHQAPGLPGRPTRRVYRLSTD